MNPFHQNYYEQSSFWDFDYLNDPTERNRIESIGKIIPKDVKTNYKICFLFKILKLSIVILFCLTSHVVSAEIYDIWDYETLLANFPKEAQGLGLDPYSPPDLLKENAETYALVLSAEVLRYKASPDKESRSRIRAGTKWLLNNKHMDKNDCKGWGFPEAWDAFGDGTINPENHEYTITNAMVLQSLLDAISINSFWETEESSEIKKVIKQVSLYWCKNVWTSIAISGIV